MANPVRSRQRFDANPQGVGYAKTTELIQYYDRILAGYEEDVTGEPATLTSTAQSLAAKAPEPSSLGGAITQDATNAGQGWSGRAYTTFHRAVSQHATSIGAATGLIQRTGTALETVSNELTTAAADMRQTRTDFMSTATRLAVEADLRAAEAPNPAAANVEHWKGYQAINQLGIDTVKKADTRARRFDTRIGTATRELGRVEQEAGGDTHNPAVNRTQPAAGGDPIARLIHRNGFEDSGPEVRSLQTMLTAQTGPDGQPLLAQVTGTWDAATQRAAEAYLTQHGLAPFDPALADPSRLPPRYQAIWPIMERAARDTGIDPVYLMAIFDREHSDDGVRGRALPDAQVGQGAINRRQLGGLHGYGIPQIDGNYHDQFLENNAYGFDPETSIPYAFGLMRERIDRGIVGGDIHKALNLYNSSSVRDSATTGDDYGLDTINRAKVFRRMLYGLDLAEPTAATPRPERATAQAGAHSANIETLVGVRNGLVDKAHQVAEVVSWLRGLRLARGTFGSRPSTEQAADGFHRAVAATANKLRLGAKGVADIAETVTGAATDYQSFDGSVRTRINATGQGAVR